MRFVGYDHSRTPVDRSGQLGSFTTGRGTEIQDSQILRKLDSIQYQLRGRILGIDHPGMVQRMVTDPFGFRKINTGTFQGMCCKRCAASILPGQKITGLGTGGV